jgi:hypothetical protein
MKMQANNPMIKLLGIFLDGFFISPPTMFRLFHPSYAAKAPVVAAMNGATRRHPSK